VIFGFHCAHEQHSPSALLRYARLAHAAGFEALMCSDHLQPWSERQGHSGCAWTWLPAALEATAATFGTVCAPGQRYHPAIVAQAAATLAEMYPGRFWLAVGTGEALNECVTGEEWPPKPLRRERLEQCVSIMRALWAGVIAENAALAPTREARLYSRPASPPPIFGAALTPATASWAARWADGLITASAPVDTMRAIVDAFRSAGGEAKPILLQVPLSYAPSDHEALAAAHDQWRHTVLTTEQLADLRSPAAFDAASAWARPQDVASRIVVSSDIQLHIGWLAAYAELGYTRIYLHNVARDHQEQFIEQVAPALLHAR
jgi:probable non-F420 flavinoid oxidoreductase